MKRLVVLLLLVGLGFALMPGQATAGPPTVGDQFYLVGGGTGRSPGGPGGPPNEFFGVVLEAGVPFHITHGWTGLDKPADRKLVSFTLFIDGVQVRGITDLQPVVDPTTGDVLYKEMSLFNFRRGMPAGEREFHGVWEDCTRGACETSEVIVHVSFKSPPS